MVSEALPSTSTPVTIEERSGLRATAEARADDIYTAFAPLLRHIAVMKFRVPRADADALVHDVFAAYFGNARSVRNARSYLIGAICNASRHYWRERKQEESFCSGDAAVPIETELVESISRKLLIATMLSRMGGKCRDLLRRYYIEGETTASIAASRTTSTDYVLLLLHQCRKTARAIVRGLTTGC
jgi:RNA polymerase sigma factor (sigma-70 family)